MLYSQIYIESQIIQIVKKWRDSSQDMSGGTCFEFKSREIFILLAILLDLATFIY